MTGRGFIDRGLRHVLDAESHALGAEQAASGPGFLQRLDPRAKVVSAALLLVAIAASRSLGAIVAVLLAVTLLAIASSIALRSIALRVWLPLVLFTLVIASPALFTTPGDPLVTLPVVSGTATKQGLRTSLFLLSRVLTAGTIAYVLVTSTTWPRVLAALRRLGVPAPVVVLLGMTYRYIFLLTGAAHDMLLSRRSRDVGPLHRREQRAVASAMMGSLMLRSLALGHDVHLAMVSRGFRGSFDSLETFRAGWRDGVALLLVVSMAALTIWSGR